MAKQHNQSSDVAGIARSWIACHKTKTQSLMTRRRLGNAYNELMAGLEYGDKTELLSAIVKRIRIKYPGLSPRHVSTQLYRAGQFARCCKHDRRLLPRLKQAGLSWRAVSGLLSLLVRRIEAPTTSRRRIDTKLKSVLDRCADGKVSPAAAVNELKSWRLDHPEHFAGRLATSTAKRALIKAADALTEADQAWEILQRHAPGFTRGRTRRFRGGVAAARAELEDVL
jgi:hypothetical protein